MKLFPRIYLPLLYACLSIIIFSPFKIKAQFTSGNITVLQVGNGSSSLVNTGNALVLKEYSSAGVLTYSMTVPFTGTDAIVVSGSASSEGFLSLSADNKYLVFGGYAKALPNSTPLPGATASTVNRAVGLVGGAGLSSYSLAASSAAFFTGANIRGAAALNSTNIWASGGSQGTNYFGTATAPVTIQNTKTNLRAIAVFNGQLYCSSQVTTGTPSTIGVYAIGTGANATSGQQVSTIIDTGTGSEPSQFYFNSAGTVCYIADKRNTTAGGIQKWVQSAGSWSLAYTLATGTAAIGATGVVANFAGTNPVVYATTTESSLNRLIAIVDLGAASTATTLATAGTAHTVFRGLAFSPCTPPSVTASANTTSICAGQTITLNATVLGSSPISYSWSGPGISAGTSQSALITAQSTAIFTVTGTNACGNASATVNINVLQQPAVISSSAIVCAGNAVTLTAGGANSYSWSTGSSSNTISVTPAVSTIYTLTGVNASGCAKTITTEVVIATTPFVTVNSATVCSAGAPATLTANGANSFTWSTGSFANAISILPSATTVYTVSGSLSGCAGVSSQTALVSVLSSPVLTISGAALNCGGSPVTQTVSGASTYTWNFGSNSDAVSVSPLVTTVYTVTGTAANGCTGVITSTITMSAPPVINVAHSPSLICKNGESFKTITLTASGATSYVWKNDLPGGPLFIDTVTINQTMNALSYSVTGVADQNCTTTVIYQIPLSICESIEDEPTETELIIYPNPATDRLTLIFSSSFKKRIRIINATGQEVYSILTDKDHINIELLHNFVKGIYTLIYTHQGKTERKKLLID